MACVSNFSLYIFTSVNNNINNIKRSPQICNFQESSRGFEHLSRCVCDIISYEDTLFQPYCYVKYCGEI
jgi:hypothetical protein